MAEFILSQDNAIHGAQLADEIGQALGVEIGFLDLVFIKPQIVRLALDNYGLEGQEGEIQAVVDAHAPNPDYFPEEVETRQRRVNFEELIAQAEAEIAWLDGAIPQVGTADLDGLRVVVERLARQSRAQIKAWRWLAKRL